MGLLFSLERKSGALMMSIGENLKEIRKRRGLTQGQLAELSGIQLTQISRLENDDTDPKASTLFKLMEALECGPDDLMGNFADLNEPGYIKQTVKRIEKLTPLKRYVVLNMVDAYCRFNTVDPSSVPLSHRGEESSEYDLYEDALRVDEKVLADLMSDTKVEPE